MDTILLVYAHDFLRRYLAEILETHGYRVLQAGQTVIAVQHLNTAVDLILCDDQIAAELFQEAPDISMIVTTTRMGIDDQAIFKTGETYLEIPFSADDLLIKVARRLKASRDSSPPDTQKTGN
jgi:CheY-like chemotaxis protein